MYKRYKKNGWIYVQTPNTVRYSELAGTVVFLSKWANFREKPKYEHGMGVWFYDIPGGR